MRKKNDILLKSAFEEAFPDLLRFFFEEADTVFDIERGFEFLDKELSELFLKLEKQGGSRFVDMLVKTHLKSGVEEWILVHIEIEAVAAKNFAQRMFQYYYRIYDRFEVEIAALAVFTGGKNQSRPAQYQKNFLGTKITYEYNAYGIMDHDEQQLLDMNNPFALIVLAAQKALLMDKIPEEELGEQRLTIARALIKSKRYDSEQIRRFLYFLKTFVHIENSEINSKFDSEINSLTNNRYAMGIIETIKMLAEEEGVEKGIEKGIERGVEIGRQNEKITLVKSLLLHTNFDNAKIANLCDVPEEMVSQLQKDLNI
jgi:predicted transposase/invertase (TIGR01784 family)